jgi:S-adenosylmethionine/arginine decarboxylase-like enzyme
MTQHNQLLVNGYTKNPIKKEEDAIAWMTNLVDAIGMKVIQGPYASYVSKKGNKGITCVVMIETSHIALHVWDEPNPSEIQFDLYTCGDLPVQQVLDNLVENLGLFNYKYLVLERELGFNQVMSGNGGFEL